MSIMSWPRSGAALILRRRRSRTAALVWSAQVSVLAAAGLICAGPAYVKIAAAIALCAYAVACSPFRACVLVGTSDGPGPGQCDLELGLGTTYTRQWARLELFDTTGRRHEALIWADALEPRDWRRLQLLLREPERSPRRVASSRR
jgi:hypothetical protein